MYIVFFIVILIVVMACLSKKPEPKAPSINTSSPERTEFQRQRELKYSRYERLCRHKRIWAVLRLVKEYDNLKQSQTFYDLEKSAEKFNKAKERLTEEDFHPSKEDISAAIRFCRIQAMQDKCDHYISQEEESRIYDWEHFDNDSTSLLKQVGQSFKCYWDDVLANYKRESDRNRRKEYLVNHLKDMKAKETMVSIPYAQDLFDELIAYYASK